MTRTRALVALFTSFVILVLAIPCPTAVRAIPTLVFCSWIPGAVLLSFLGDRSTVAPNAPAIGASLGLMVLISQLALLLHHPLGRTALLVTAIVTFLLLLAPLLLRLPEPPPARR